MRESPPSANGTMERHRVLHEDREAGGQRGHEHRASTRAFASALPARSAPVLIELRR